MFYLCRIHCLITWHVCETYRGSCLSRHRIGHFIAFWSNFTLSYIFGAILYTLNCWSFFNVRRFLWTHFLNHYWKNKDRKLFYSTPAQVEHLNCSSRFKLELSGKQCISECIYPIPKAFQAQLGKQKYRRIICPNRDRRMDCLVSTQTDGFH